MFPPLIKREMDFDNLPPMRYTRYFYLHCNDMVRLPELVNKQVGEWALYNAPGLLVIQYKTSVIAAIPYAQHDTTGMLWNDAVFAMDEKEMRVVVILLLQAMYGFCFNRDMLNDIVTDKKISPERFQSLKMLLVSTGVCMTRPKDLFEFTMFKSVESYSSLSSLSSQSSQYV